MHDRFVSAGLVTDHASPFALPRGTKGRLAGWYMALPDRQHRELLEVIPLPEAGRLLEVGFGPGQLLAAFRRRQPGLELCGVDPSDVMLAMARRRNRGADLRLGTATAMPYPDDHADVVVSVNNIVLWPDLDGGLAEIARVLTPDGHAYLAWHGGTQPRGHQRRLVLDEQRNAAVAERIRSNFATVDERVLRHSVLWEVSC